MIWGHLSSILGSAVDDQRLLRNPMKVKNSVKPPRAIDSKAKAWSREVVDAVRAELQDRYQIAVDLGIGLRLRQGEAFGLAEKDFDFAAGVVRLRRLPSTSCTLPWRKPIAVDLILIRPVGEKVRHDGNRIRRIPRYAAPREAMFQVLQHTYASVQLEADESVVGLSKWLGHSTPRVTLDHYAHFMPG